MWTVRVALCSLKRIEDSAGRIHTAIAYEAGKTSIEDLVSNKNAATEVAAQ